MMIDHETSCPCIYCSPRARRQPTTQELLDAAEAENVRLHQRIDEQIDRIQFEIDNVHQIHGDTCLCGFTSSRSRSRTEHLTALFAEAVLSSLALEPEALDRAMQLNEQEEER